MVRPCRARARRGDGMWLRRLLRVRRSHPDRLPADLRGRSRGRGGGPRRLVAGAVTARSQSVLSTRLGALELEHPVLNGSGTFDAIAALRVFGPALLERF